MALRSNGNQFASSGVQHYGATAVLSAIPHVLQGKFVQTGRMRNLTAGEGITSELVGIPSGYRHPGAWMLPQKAGALSSHNNTQGSSTATLSMASGRNMAATADGVSTASATLQLVVSLAGTAAGSASVSGNVVASLSAAGTSAGSSTAAATAGAIAWAYGAAPGSCTVSATLTASGRLYGSISPFTELSPENLASAVIAAAEVSPLHADIRKVNAYTIDGDGSGTPWGPV
jgi:hypothetical protein